MFESFYKLHPTPFRLTPDPHFFFESETHKRGLAYLRFAFYQREGFVAITGAPGTGKTELTLNLIEELPHNKVTLAKIVTTNLDADDLLDLVAESFNIDIGNVGKGSELKKLENFFLSEARTGKQVLLIIDEAHNLSVKSLLELSMLENFQLNEKPLLQCFLLGQLPLEDKLNLPELEPLKQRVIASARLENLDQKETREYIVHRLSKSGWNNNPSIDDDAFFFIYHYTKGVPRKINSLCNRLLLHSYVESEHKISADSVKLVIQEMQQEAVWESLDVDFAQTVKVSESALNSPKHSEAQPVLHREKKAQQPIMALNDGSQDSSSTEDEIDVPVFLKKTQDQNSSSITKMLKEIRETDIHEPDTHKLDTQKPDTHKPKWGDTRSKKQEQYQARQTTRVPQSNGGNTSVVTDKHVTHRPVKRTSGLLDKELQFLASLAESNALATELPATSPEQNPEPETAPEPEQATKPEVTSSIVDQYPEQETTSVRKVIIDESVYDNNELIDTNYETDWQEDKTKLPIINDWRQTTLAGLVVGTLIISISWLYESDSGPANTVAVSQPENKNSKTSMSEAELFAPDTPVDIDLPSIASSDTQAETTFSDAANSNTNHSDAFDETGNHTKETGTSVTTTSATEVTSATNSSDVSNHSQSGELDNQLTQILENSSPAPVTDNGATSITKTGTTKNDTSSKLAALSNDQHSTDPVRHKTTSGESDSKSNSIKPKTTKHTQLPVTGSLAPTPGVVDSKSVTTQKNSAGSNLVKPSTQTTLSLNKATERVPPSTVATSPRPNTASTSVTMLNTGQDSTIHRPEPTISKADLSTLLSRLSDAYQNGNLQELVMTFASDIKSSDGSSRQQMLKEYQRLFNITDRRQLAIQNVKWSTKDRQMLGEGNFEVLIREKGATKYTTYQGKISFAVAKESDGVVIKKLDYDYGQ